MRTLTNTRGPLAHILAGLVPLAWYAALARELPHWGLIFLCCVFSLLPDIDTGASLIGYLFPWLSESIERRFGHRTITHSFLALVAVAAAAWFLFPDGWHWLTAAYGSHLVLDMIVGGLAGVPLLWPANLRFYLVDVQPGGVGESVLVGLLLVLVVLPIIWPSSAVAAASVVPQRPTSPPSPTPTLTPTIPPDTITIRVSHVRDPDKEILVQPGSLVQPGDLVADLQIFRRINTDPPTPTPTDPPTPTNTSSPSPTSPVASPTPRPVALQATALAADLDQARARYQRTIATPTPDTISAATFQIQAADISAAIQDRRDALSRCAQENSCDHWSYQVAAQELADLQTQAAIIADAITTALFPPSPDNLTIAVARADYNSAQADYNLSLAALDLRTPTPTPTASPTPTPSPTLTPFPTLTPAPTLTPDPAADQTRIRSLVTGRVVKVEIVSVVGNEATVEIIVELEPGASSPASSSNSNQRIETPESSHLAAGDSPNAAVVRVVDGDTVIVNWEGVEESVRLIGVDTPETKHPSEPVGCYGPEASAFTESLLPPGASVHLQLDEEPRDRYGRLLAYIYLNDGTMINEILLTGGYGRVLTIRPNDRHAVRFLDAERQAQAGGLGLWGSCGE